MGSGIECILSKFANDTEMCGADNMVEGKNVIQRNLDRLERWVCANLMKFNKAKCKRRRWRPGCPCHSQRFWLPLHCETSWEALAAIGFALPGGVSSLLRKRRRRNHLHNRRVTWLERPPLQLLRSHLRNQCKCMRHPPTPPPPPPRIASACRRVRLSSCPLCFLRQSPPPLRCKRKRQHLHCRQMMRAETRSLLPLRFHLRKWCNCLCLLLLPLLRCPARPHAGTLTVTATKIGNLPPTGGVARWPNAGTDIIPESSLDIAPLSAGSECIGDGPALNPSQVASEQTHLGEPVAPDKRKIGHPSLIGSEQLQQGHTEPSTSPWNTPVFVIKKKSGKWRLLQDLRKINAVMESMGALQPGMPSPTMLPTGWEILIIDLKDCFFTIPLHPDDKPKFTFTVLAINNAEPVQRYQWKVLPQGCRNSPTICRWYVAQALSGVCEQFPDAYCYHYMDDILVAASTQDELLRIQPQLFAALYSYGLQVAPEKVQQHPRKYLGVKILDQTIQHQEVQFTDSIKTLNDTQKLLGVISWLRPYLGLTTTQFPCCIIF
ncbi:uncharacterized protein [Anomalospiza imberbis]|uniref:uncharacterized protein n=1 Tax=Anomalospiza imberbis TaxID=187417 RepID=UPI00358FEBC5